MTPIARNLCQHHVLYQFRSVSAGWWWRTVSQFVFAQLLVRVLPPTLGNYSHIPCSKKCSKEPKHGQQKCQKCFSWGTKQVTKGAHEEKWKNQTQSQSLHSWLANEGHVDGAQNGTPRWGRSGNQVRRSTLHSLHIHIQASISHQQI